MSSIFIFLNMLWITGQSLGPEQAQTANGSNLDLFVFYLFIFT